MPDMELDRIRAALSRILTDPGCGNAVISGVCNRSDEAGPGKLFCAIRGSRADGHDFIADALKRGASAVCAAEDWTGTIPADIPLLRVRDPYFAWGILCGEAAGRPADSFRVHTVTGTNGKTTIAFILHHLLKTAHRKTGLITTVLFDDGSGKCTESSTTMPDAENLQKLFLAIRDQGADDAVMESSSHGLHQHRAGDLKFSSAIFTNLAGDHLDYHKTMENYYQAKRLLFTEMLKDSAPAVIHTMDDYGKRLFRELGGNKLEFSQENPAAFCHLKRVTPDDSGATLDFTLDGYVCRWHSPLRGEHNAANLLEACACAYALGLDLDTLRQGAESAPPAPGRLEPVTLLSGATAFVDYAHTDDALMRVLTALRRILKPGGRLIAVFGCGGDRDRTKRPRMGRAVAEHSDFFIVTSDNPRTEDPLAIIREIETGIPAGTAYETEPDRAEAIRRAASLTGPLDILLVAGKGHETYQDVMGVKRHFDDREQLRALGGK